MTQPHAVLQHASDEAWEDLFDALPRGWMIGRPPRDSASGTHRLYAFERRARRRAPPEVAVEAESEEQALRELADQLRNIDRSRKA